MYFDNDVERGCFLDISKDYNDSINVVTFDSK